MKKRKYNESEQIDNNNIINTIPSSSSSVSITPLSSSFSPTHFSSRATRSLSNKIKLQQKREKWNNIPDISFALCFQFLNVKEMISCALCCSSWHRICTSQFFLNLYKRENYYQMNYVSIRTLVEKAMLDLFFQSPFNSLCNSITLSWPSATCALSILPRLAKLPLQKLTIYAGYSYTHNSVAEAMHVDTIQNLCRSWSSTLRMFDGRCTCNTQGLQIAQNFQRDLFSSLPLLVNLETLLLEDFPTSCDYSILEHLSSLQEFYFSNSDFDVAVGSRMLEQITKAIQSWQKLIKLFIHLPFYYLQWDFFITAVCSNPHLQQNLQEFVCCAGYYTYNQLLQMTQLHALTQLPPIGEVKFVELLPSWPKLKELCLTCGLQHGQIIYLAQMKEITSLKILKTLCSYYNLHESFSGTLHVLESAGILSQLESLELIGQRNNASSRQLCNMLPLIQLTKFKATKLKNLACCHCNILIEDMNKFLQRHTYPGQTFICWI